MTMRRETPIIRTYACKGPQRGVCRNRTTRLNFRSFVKQNNVLPVPENFINKFSFKISTHIRLTSSRRKRHDRFHSNPQFDFRFLPHRTHLKYHSTPTSRQLKPKANLSERIIISSKSHPKILYASVRCLGVVPKLNVRHRDRYVHYYIDPV